MVKTILLIAALITLSSLTWAQKAPALPSPFAKLSQRERLLHNASLHLTPAQSKALNITPTQRQRFKYLNQKRGQFMGKINARHDVDSLTARVHYTTSSLALKKEREWQDRVAKWRGDIDMMTTIYIKARVAVYTSEQRRKLLQWGLGGVINDFCR